MKILKRRASKVLLVILCIILLFAGGAYGYVRYTLGKIKTVDLNLTPEQLGVVPYSKPSGTSTSTPDVTKPVEEKPDITNIALIGVDKKNPDGSQRSDTVIVASIDKEHKKIKMTSIMRDSYIEEPGLGYSRMGHTNSDGGPVLTIKTINKNFKLDITDYVKVDFDGLIGIVDAIGGVKVTIKDYEVPGMAGTGISKAGTYNLNGQQALAYARIRHYGNQDYERTERQRDIMETIFQKVSSQGATAMVSNLNKILPYVETSLSTSKIIDMGYDVLASGTKTVVQNRIPYDDDVKTTYIDSIYYLTFDKDKTAERLHKFIYED